MRYILTIGWLFFLICNHTLAQGGYDQIRSDQVRTINGKNFFIHHVKKGQTLYAISKAYDVDMQDIIDSNPEIKQGLKANQTLLIPAPVAMPSPELAPPIEPEVTDPPVIELNDLYGDSLRATARELSTGLPCGKKKDPGKEFYNVALMMHLFLKESDTINTEGPTQKEIEGYNSFRYIQFYEGFLLAVDSLRKTGLNLNLYVYSLETNPATTYTFLKKPEMEKMDLIIGMLFNRNFEIVATWAKDHQIPVVSPVSERESQVEGNPIVIKILPSYTSEGIALAEYIAANHRFSRTLLIRSWEEESKQMADQIYANFKVMGMDITAVSQDGLISKLNRGTENVVVVVSRQKPFVMNVLSQLNVDTNGYKFILFGLPRWDQFEGMDYQYMEKVKGHIFVPSWINYEDPAVKRIVSQFRDIYKTEPEKLAFQGYDIAWYFLQALKQYGTHFSDCLMEISIKPFLTHYKFRRVDGNGWENHHWEVLRYDNYSLIPLN